MPQEQLLGLTPDGEALRLAWLIEARDSQLPPDGDWFAWWLRSGRGYGKTYTGAQYIADMARQFPGTRWAVVAPTQGDCRDTCFEGESGLLAVIAPDEIKGTFNRAEIRLTLKNGSVIKGFSAEKPNRLRGPQHHGAWAEEVSSWERAKETWDNLELGLRLKLPKRFKGDTPPRPRVVATSTPKKNEITRTLDKDPAVIKTTGSTYENAENLDPEYVQRLRDKYEGTVLGEQELYGRVLEDAEGALWRSEWIHRPPEDYSPSLTKTCVGWDPAVTSKKGSDKHGIIGGALCENGDVLIGADESGVMTPVEAARRCIKLAERIGATEVIMEDNQGKDTWSSVWKEAGGDDTNVKLKPVSAKASKEERAIPLATAYEQAHNRREDPDVRKIYHMHKDERLAELEAEMCDWVPAESPKSPNRIDALVWMAHGLGIRVSKRKGKTGMRRAGRLSKVLGA